MTEMNKKLTGGKKFMSDLSFVARDKESLLLMARDVIRKSPSQRSYNERKLPEDQTALNMHATFAIAGVIKGKDLSTDQRLILIKQRYQKHGFGDFDKDFKKAYPQEYGVKTANLSPLAIQAARRAAGLMV